MKPDLWHHTSGWNPLDYENGQVYYSSRSCPRELKIDHHIPLKLSVTPSSQALLNICFDDKRTNTTVVFCRWRYKITTVVWRCLSCANEFSSKQMSKSMECQQGQKTSATKQKHNTTVFRVWVFRVVGVFCVLGFWVFAFSHCHFVPRSLFQY